jgi:hypothetical protein
MPADKYRFISPGVFTKEIDQSQLEDVVIDQRGPLVIGRSRRGPSFLPVTVHSYADYVQTFGEPVAGGGAIDGWRNPGEASPTYAAYAAEAYLRNNQPLTFVRLLGAQHPDQSGTGGVNGWKAGSPDTSPGGAYGLFVFPSGTVANSTGTLAAVWYCNASASLTLTGTINGGTIGTASNSTLLQGTSTSAAFKVQLSQSNGTEAVKSFNFSINDSNYVRNVFNTDPTQLNSNLYAANESKGYFLGPTFERAVADLGTSTGNMVGVMMQIQTGSAEGGDFTNLKASDGGPPTAKTGWFKSQDMNTPNANFDPGSSPQNLFRIHALYSSGQEAQNSVKISIRDLRFPSAQEQSVNPYPSFTLEVRDIDDTDLDPRVLEAFVELNLNPNSPNYIATRIGDRYLTYNTTERRIEMKGDYSNNSKYIRLEMHADLAQGGANPSMMPFGVAGPPTYKNFQLRFFGQGGSDVSDKTGSFSTANTMARADKIVNRGASLTAVDEILWATGNGITSSLDDLLIKYPKIPLVTSASQTMGNNGQKNAYFGVDLGESAGSKRLSHDIVDLTRILPAGLSETSGVATAQYNFTLDNVVETTVDGITQYIYQEGARAGDFSYTAGNGASALVNTVEINKFTTVLYGGSDQLDIRELDPFRNTLLAGSNVLSGYGSTEVTNYAVASIQRAINIITDPEDASFDLTAIPGLTNENLTNNLVNMCEERADALAVIDVQKDYQPRAEGSPNRYPVLPNVTNAVNTWRTRSTDSSYGCAFFPWVQTRDERSGQLLWIPPSIAALGTMGSSAARSELWFAPAGFNRGGLSQGAAGIPVTNVRKKLTSKQRDKLYENRINPIASFPSEGIVIFGQKTLQVQSSALDRINVRRLLIFLKKQISTIANNVLFDQNIPATWNRFVSRVEPLLSDVQTRYGLTDYQLVLDNTTTTPDLIDRNVMYAKILLKPARAIEFIALDFFITSAGASFED